MTYFKNITTFNKSVVVKLAKETNNRDAPLVVFRVVDLHAQPDFLEYAIDNLSNCSILIKSK